MPFSPKKEALIFEKKLPSVSVYKTTIVFQLQRSGEYIEGKLEIEGIEPKRSYEIKEEIRMGILLENRVWKTVLGSLINCTEEERKNPVSLQVDVNISGESVKINEDEQIFPLTFEQAVARIEDEVRWVRVLTPPPCLVM